MDTHYAQTAAAIAAILATFMPYLVEGAKGIAKGFGESLGKISFEKAKSI